MAILSDNSIDHALLALGAMHVGVPVAPISPAYSLMSKDFAKLKMIFELLEPGLVWTSDAAKFAAALDAVGAKSASLAKLLETNPGSTQERESAKVNPDTVAKILFTSGSTGVPKGVINTHRMLCANQQMLAQAWPFVEDEPPVVVDWLPWNHTFGGNHNFNLVLRNGGTMYDRRRQAGAGPDRDHGAQPDGSGTDDVLQRAARLRPAAALPREGRAAAAQFLQPTST